MPVLNRKLVFPVIAQYESLSKCFIATQSYRQWDSQRILNTRQNYLRANIATEMPPKKLPLGTSQQKQQSQSASKPENQKASTTTSSTPVFPEHEIKQSSAISAQLALEAANGL